METTVIINGGVEEVLGLARGSYQRGLLLGAQNWSGSDLRGKAARFGGQYAQSRRRLRDRLEKDRRFIVTESRGPRGQHVVTITVRTPAIDSALRLNAAVDQVVSL